MVSEDSTSKVMVLPVTVSFENYVRRQSRVPRLINSPTLNQPSSTPTPTPPAPTPTAPAKTITRKRNNHLHPSSTPPRPRIARRAPSSFTPASRTSPNPTSSFILRVTSRRVASSSSSSTRGRDVRTGLDENLHLGALIRELGKSSVFTRVLRRGGSVRESRRFSSLRA